MCLIIKSGSKMVKISDASYENEIHRIDSHFNKDSKNINLFGQGGPNFGGGTAGKSRGMAQNSETYCYAS